MPDSPDRSNNHETDDATVAALGVGCFGVGGLLAKPEIKAQLVKLSLLPMDNKPVPEMQAFVKSEIARWGKVVEAAGIAGSQ